MEFSFTKETAYSLKIAIQIRQKICSLAAKAATRAKAIAEAKVEANVFKDLYNSLFRDAHVKRFTRPTFSTRLNYL